MPNDFEDLFRELTERELRQLKQGRRVYEILICRGITQDVNALEKSKVKRMAAKELRRRKRQRRGG